MLLHLSSLAQSQDSRSGVFPFDARHSFSPSSIIFVYCLWTVQPEPQVIGKNHSAEQRYFLFWSQTLFWEFLACLSDWGWRLGCLSWIMNTWSRAQPGCCASSVALPNSKSNVLHLNSSWPLNAGHRHDLQPALLVLTSSIRNVLLDFRGSEKDVLALGPYIWLRSILQPKANFILSRLGVCRWQFLGSVLEAFWQDWHQVCYIAFLKCKIGFS